MHENMEGAWHKSLDAVCFEMGSQLQKGLATEEAKRRFKQIGPNALPKKGRVAWWGLFFRQFSSGIVWLLMGAAVIAGWLGNAVDAWAIVLIVFFNALLGFFQEFRAERMLQALQKLSSPNAKVVREGILRSVPSEEIVPGDLLLLEAGDRIAADGRLVKLSYLSIDEAPLTGESVPVQKELEALHLRTPLSDRKNMVFKGTTVASGRGYAVVIATGMQTEMGQIASAILDQKQEQTPLQRKLSHLGQKLVYLCLAIVAMVFCLGLVRGLALVEMLLFSLSLAVAAIPEGLPAAVTISLSVGVRKMAEKRALVRRLSSVETLGSTQVICTDKTGTLTQSEMTVKKIYLDGQLYDVSGSGYEPKGEITPSSPSMEKALQIAVLCNNADIFEEGRRWVCGGDPTECALLTAGMKGGVDRAALESRCRLLEEIPFDSDRKMMSVVLEGEGGKCLYIKGAPDVLLQRSNRMLMRGEIAPLEREMIEEAHQQLAGDAYRVLAVAYQPDADKGEESHLIFVGLFAMIDPPRPEVKQAIAHCQRAGIQTLMVTGDHKATAEAIARELGMDVRGVATGSQLDTMTDAEVGEVTIFSRISATHKLRIIKALKGRQIVTAMTGDGVNDAPAIAAADIGVAMGITGTDVTKESSDMIILDDNFATIVEAVKQGRAIYDNIVKFVSYLLSSNAAEILVIALAMLLGIRGPNGEAFIPLLPIQLLWMNLVTDGFPAIALALDPIDPRAMSRPPRPKGEQILNCRFSLFIFFISLLITAGALTACFWGLQRGVAYAQTITFTTLIVLELVRAQMIRRQYRLGLFSNPYLIAALASSLLLQLAVVYIPPLERVFGTVPLDMTAWAVIGGIATLLFWLGLVVTKLFYKET